VRSFDFSRVFLYKWNVNWKFLSVDVFLSREFAVLLLLLHVILILVFTATRWIRMLQLTYSKLLGLAKVDDANFLPVSANTILTIMYTANLIGALCARSLHYQFYSWISWGTPFLLWQTRLPGAVQVGIWALQEIAWNIYPATSSSSAIVVGAMAVVLFGVWWADINEPDRVYGKLEREARIKEGLKVD
jgi:alpha-1,3-mannosyltransferase